MERGLRKVLPKLTDEQKNRFAHHMLPVIIELCGASLSDEEQKALIDKLTEAFAKADENTRQKEDDTCAQGTQGDTAEESSGACRDESAPEADPPEDSG